MQWVLPKAAINFVLCLAHPPSPRTRIPAVFRKNYKTAGVAPFSDLLLATQCLDFCSSYWTNQSCRTDTICLLEIFGSLKCQYPKETSRFRVQITICLQKILQ